MLNHFIMKHQNYFRHRIMLSLALVLMLTASIRPFELKAQSDSSAPLQFNHLITDCLDKWIIFPPSQDSLHFFGFLYLDIQAGFTFQYEGRLKIQDGNISRVQPPEEANNSEIKLRMSPDDGRKFALLPTSQFEALKIKAIPQWRPAYNYDSTKATTLYQLGFIYNGGQRPDKGLYYLKKARALDPKLKGLATEMAFSYNALKQFDSAEVILEKEILANPGDAYTVKEYIYTATHNGHMQKATDAFNTIVQLKPDFQYAEEALANILHAYFLKKDKENFNEWYQIYHKYSSSNKEIREMIEAMNQQLDQAP